jgi:oxygen-independent coproporphyrinogen III oxidase
MPLGLYISVPFCKQKCSFCNFASGVFPREKMQAYVDRVGEDMAQADEIAEYALGRLDDRCVDTVYFGGGTPTVLAPEQLRQLFDSAHKEFQIAHGTEITVECAPGTLSAEMLATLVSCGVNRVSLGVQSFIAQEAHAVGRMHTPESVCQDIAQLRSVGITNVSVDLIAGLPHQTPGSWERSLDDVIASGVPHVSVYILEVDDESRLGMEMMAGGKRYHAHDAPNEDIVADLYERACERLSAAGLKQYEISNFAKPGSESRHNLKYWERKPYFGFGLDASSMLRARPDHDPLVATRFSTPSDLEEYLNWGREAGSELISPISALEEEFFLGLRLNRGIDLKDVLSRFKAEDFDVDYKIHDLLEAGLVELYRGILKLTPKGRLLSNEVFERFISIGTEDDLRDILGLDPDQPLPVVDSLKRVQ